MMNNFKIEKKKKNCIYVNDTLFLFSANIAVNFVQL